MSKSVRDELREFQSNLKEFRRLYEADGSISQEEQDHLNALAKRIEDLQLVIDVGLDGDDGASNGSADISGGLLGADNAGRRVQSNAIPGVSGNVSADASGGSHDSQLDLLFEQKVLEDKLKAPKSYRGREADEARLEEIRRKLGQQPIQTPPPPKDPRIAQLAEITRRELSADLDPNTALLLDRKLNGKMIEEYYEIRRELQDNYLNNIDPQKHTSKDVGNEALKAWSKAIYDLGELRRILANNLVVQERDAIKEEQKTLQGLHKDLQTLKEKNKRVQQEVERIERIKGAAKWAGHLLHLNDALEVFGGGVEGVAKLPVITVNALTVVSHTDFLSASHKIVEGIEYLAQYPIQYAVAAEGFSSIDALEKAIKRKVDHINEVISKIKYLARSQERAQRIYDTAVSEAPKTK